MGMTSKADLQAKIDEQQRKIEGYKETVGTLQDENHFLLNSQKSLQDTTRQQDKRIDALNEAISGTKKELDASKKQAAEYKREIDGLSDTKSVLDNLMSILRSPHNDYQKVVTELRDELQREKVRADGFQRDLINAQCDLQRIQFLEGKVQAYEAMFRVNPIKTAWGEIEQQGMPSGL